MSQASSLALLTGNQTNIGSQLPDADPEAEAEAAEAEETIDVDTMNTKEIEQLVKDYAIETPKGWSKFKLAEKRQWLNDNFGDDEDETPVDEGSDQTAEEQGAERNRARNRPPPRPGRRSPRKPPPATWPPRPSPMAPSSSPARISSPIWSTRSRTWTRSPRSMRP
ncbi:MAG: hypothetical protein LC676_19760 [Loktanella sp.]|nr:hypothetical protein [Loktanella sp.]